MIQSSQNPLIKKISKLKEKKFRDEYGLFVVEGEKLVDEALDWDVESFLMTETFVACQDVRKYKDKAPVYLIRDELLKKVSDTVNPQGLIAIARQKKHTTINESKNPFIVVCERISDPGNLGAIIRTANAAGAEYLVLSKESTDLYSPKTVRAAAGAIFHLPVINDIELKDFIAQAKRKGMFFFGAHLKADTYPYTMDLKIPCAFVIGNEANGLTSETSALMDALVKIPMQPNAESLNVSVACGVLMYEVVRQRLS